MAAYLIVVTILGPECVLELHIEVSSTDVSIWDRNHASHFEEAKTAFEEGAGHDEMHEHKGKPRSMHETEGKEEGETV